MNVANQRSSYVKIWSARPWTNPKDNTTLYFCQASVATKSEQTGEYHVWFNGQLIFKGSAAEKVATLNLPVTSDRDHPVGKSVKIIDLDIGSYFNKKKCDNLLAKANGDRDLEFFIRDKCNELTLTIFEIELDGEQTSKKQINKDVTNEEFMNVPETDDAEGLPF